MSIIWRAQVPNVKDNPSPGAVSQPMTNGELGAVSLTITEVLLPPGGEIPLHVHPGHEESIIILEGELEAVVGEEHEVVTAGNAVLAPDGVKHALVNRSDSPATILAVFPTTDVKREFL